MTLNQLIYLTICHVHYFQRIVIAIRNSCIWKSLRFFFILTLRQIMTQNVFCVACNNRFVIHHRSIDDF